MLYTDKYFTVKSIYTDKINKHLMGRLNIVIDDAIEEDFRREVGKRLGAKKGSIKIAIEDAIKLWMEQKK